MTEEQAEALAKARIFLEITREIVKISDRLIEILHLLKVPEYGYKNELRKEKCELLERVEKLNWKLRRL